MIGKVTLDTIEATALERCADELAAAVVRTRGGKQP